MKKTLIPILAVVALAWFNTGCQHHEGAYPPVNANMYNYETEAKFAPLDAAVQRSVTCPSIQRRTLPDGRLEVTANLRNRENRRIQVQVNCVFKDEQFFPTDETPFQDIILTENETKGISFVSMNDKAKNFTIRARQSH